MVAQTTASAVPAGSNRPQVSDALMEFLMTELLNYVSQSTTPKPTSIEGEKNSNSSADKTAPKDQQQVVLSKEMAAAKMERMGYNVGYRLCERLAQHRTFSGASSSQNKDPALATAAAQLEVVKFLCKEVWMEVFRKQIDKLQTNHRGVFVLKDLELRWLTRLPPQQEGARLTAIQLLAFPCGIIRGTLANLNIPAVVSCDFMADGQHMSACSFNVKIK